MYLETTGQLRAMTRYQNAYIERLQGMGKAMPNTQEDY
jgi:hypothetical protein